jgi:glucose/mannose-6-phosphate isomerase
MLEVVADVVAVWAEGDGALAQFFDLVLFGDFVSLHLAGHEGVDPGPVPILIEIKERLAAGEDPPG